jgi:hypothetical protein
VFHRTTLQSYPKVRPLAKGSDLLVALLGSNFLTASSVTMRRDLVIELGGFSPAAAPSDDWDLWLRLANAGHAFVRAGEQPLVLLRESATSQSKDDLLMAESALRTLVRAQAIIHNEARSARRLAADRITEVEAAIRRGRDRGRWSVGSAGARGARAVLRPLTSRWRWRRPDAAQAAALGEVPGF